MACETSAFSSSQAAYVARYIRKKYGRNPEHLWARSARDAIWRRGDNAKWFAGIFHVSRTRIEAGDDARIEILNLRSAPAMTDMVVDKKTVFPGWHMNKRTWITIILDGRVDTDNICRLVDNSYVLAGGK